MLSALEWIPKGSAKPIPSFETPSDENELENIIERPESVPEQKEKVEQMDAELAEYNLDTYDDEDPNEGFEEAIGIKNLTFYKSPDEDPYLADVCINFTSYLYA
jgi:hypothetical protein